MAPGFLQILSVKKWYIPWTDPIYCKFPKALLLRDLFFSFRTSYLLSAQHLCETGFYHKYKIVIVFSGSNRNVFHQYTPHNFHSVHSRFGYKKK